MKRSDFAEASALHIDAALTNYSQQYKNEELIWQEIMPPVKVGKRSDKYFKYDKDQRFTLPETLIGPKSKAGEVDLKVSTDNYSVKDYGLEEFVSQAEMDNADNPLDPARDALDFLMELLMLDQEDRVATAAQAAGNYATTSSPVTKWDAASSTPVTDILTALDNPFMRPNIIWFGADAWRAFRSNAQVLDAVKGATRNQGSNGGIASREDVASLFEVEKILVGRSRKNTAKEGQTATFARLWSDNCGLIHRKTSLSPRSITWGCSFMETQMLVSRRRDDSRGIKGGEVIKAVHNSDEKVKATDLGHLITDTNT